ncbi:MAG: acetyl-CoA acetyltransferase [Alphaproteobacteria bacterium RIFCSPHIGHO2_12_FULL_63_12]|nr:MAG: acetyl-CoA acetyltransferase [Alphaproteobacteria bacterium RIFCSPHIGHO2_12_FULL_63_12]
MPARRAVIIDIVRSPFGKGRPDGALAGIHPVDLYAQVLRALVARTGIDPALIEDAITGCVLQVGEQAGNIGRQAVLAAGLPETVPAVTLDRKCGSAQQAIDFAAQGVIAGAYDVVIAGGVEMMSLVPMRSNRLGKDSEGPLFRARYPNGLPHQGVSAEMIAARWALSRSALDSYALRSHQLAAKAEDAGVTARSIVPIKNQRETELVTVARDEGLRRDTSLEKLAALKSAYRTDALAVAHPELGWVVTAGNASQVTDGAAAILIAEEKTAERLGLKPRAAALAFAVAADDPALNLAAPMPATRKLLSRAGLSLDRIDCFEVNEAFAAVVLAFAKELEVDLGRVNRLGGAIALGHPVGASGGRLLAALLDSLDAAKGRYGLLTMCESGGMANATLFERF